jgi:hypothetical protein
VEGRDRRADACRRGTVEGEADRHRVEGGCGSLVVEAGVPAVEPRDQDDVPVFAAEVPTIPRRALKWPDRAVTAWKSAGAASAV